MTTQEIFATYTGVTGFTSQWLNKAKWNTVRYVGAAGEGSIY